MNIHLLPWAMGSESMLNVEEYLFVRFCVCIFWFRPPYTRIVNKQWKSERSSFRLILSNSQWLAGYFNGRTMRSTRILMVCIKMCGWCEILVLPSHLTLAFRPEQANTICTYIRAGFSSKWYFQYESTSKRPARERELISNQARRVALCSKDDFYYIF